MKNTLEGMMREAMAAHGDALEGATLAGGAVDDGSIDRPFVNEYGGGPDFNWGLVAWTAGRVYQVREYDGFLFIGSVPRHPETFVHDDGQDDNG